MVAVGDEHGGEPFLGQSRPHGVAVAVEQIGTAVAQVGQQLGARVGGGPDLRVVRHVVAHGNVDAQLAGPGDGFGGVFGVGADGDDLDEAVGVEFIHGGLGGDLDPGGVVGADGSGRDEGAFEVDAGDPVQVAVGLDGLLDDGDVPAVEFHGAGDDGGQENLRSRGEKFFRCLDDHVAREFRIGKVHTVVAVDLQVDPTGILHLSSPYFSGCTTIIYIT